jgi:hypothetical protein
MGRTKPGTAPPRTGLPEELALRLRTDHGVDTTALDLALAASSPVSFRTNPLKPSPACGTPCHGAVSDTCYRTVRHSRSIPSYMQVHTMFKRRRACSLRRRSGFVDLPIGPFWPSTSAPHPGKEHTPPEPAYPCFPIGGQ